ELADHRLGQVPEAALLSTQELGQPSKIGAPLVHDLVRLTASLLHVARARRLGVRDDLGGDALGAVHDLVDPLRGPLHDALELRSGATARRTRRRALARRLVLR